MPTHPPWLRFQAYVIGLPKTGSTSLATVFGRYRTGHEWQMSDLVRAALDRRRGALTDDGFLAATGRRLVPPSLEMDSATTHHLYVDVLRDRYPDARFVHTVRDVLGWTTSLLDMVLRKRRARLLLADAYGPWEREYLASMVGDAYDPDGAGEVDDSAALVPAMRYWAAHLREVAAQAPPERTLRLATGDIGHRIVDLAGLVGVPPSTLRVDLARTNRSPATLDRFAAFDGEPVRAAYEEHCGELMAELFPAEDAAYRARPVRPDPGAWTRHLRAVDTWAVEQVARYGSAAGR